MKKISQKLSAAGLLLACLTGPRPAQALTIPPTPTPFDSPNRPTYHGLNYVRPPMRSSLPAPTPQWFSFYPTPTPAKFRSKNHPLVREVRKTEPTAPLNGGPPLTPVPTPTPFSAWNWKWKKDYQTLYQDPKNGHPQFQATPLPGLLRWLRPR